MKPIRKRSMFTLIELVIVIAILAFVGSIFLPSSETIEQAKIWKCEDDIRKLHTASIQWMVKQNQTTFTGVSISQMITDDILPSGAYQSGENPFGGDYTCVPNSSNANQLDITLDNLPATAQDLLDDKLTKTAVATDPEGTDPGYLTVTY